MQDSVPCRSAQNFSAILDSRHHEPGNDGPILATQEGKDELMLALSERGGGWDSSVRPGDFGELSTLKMKIE